jgi:hypothetical protein
MDPRGKGMVVNDKEKESFINEPKDDKLSHPVLKVNRMRTMYVPGSVIHVHSDYINDSS